MQRCLRFVVSGLVQGVFYRASAEATARSLGLTGWVRNTLDGSVELIACGTSEQLAALERWLWQGPPSARVTHVHRAEAPLEAFEDFAVRR